MPKPRRLLCVFAHPDDESLGVGGTLAKYAADGVDIHLVTATRGEHGWFGSPQEKPDPGVLGKIREEELRAAANVLGIREVHFLNYIDGFLDEAKPLEVISKIAAHIRRVKPQVVITFGPDGGYGHPDHIAISQFTTAAITGAADPAFQPDLGAHHRVSKLYFKVWTEAEQKAYQSAFGDLIMTIDGQERSSVGWENWAITTRIDTAKHWSTVWEAVQCHRSQLQEYSALANLTEEHHEGLWGCDGFYRAFSLVNGGRTIEDDLFDGLHDENPRSK